MIPYPYLKSMGIDEDLRKTPLLALYLISINDAVTLGEAGRLIYRDTSRYHKIKDVVKEAVDKKYLIKIKDDESKISKYKCNTEKIVKEIIEINKEESKNRSNWWSRIFKKEYSKYDHLDRFWNNEKIKRVFFDRQLILNILRDNLSHDFLLDSFCYFMELPIFILLHSQMLNEADKVKEIETLIKPNIIYHLFRIEGYVKRLKELEKDLLWILHDEDALGLIKIVIDLHKTGYKTGKKVFTYLTSELQPEDTELKFMSEFSKIKEQK